MRTLKEENVRKLTLKLTGEVSKLTTLWFNPLQILETVKTKGLLELAVASKYSLE